MFSLLADKLNQAFKNISGRSKLTEDNITTALREVRIALLEADVALPVVKQFIENIRAKAIGEKIISSTTASQTLIKLVNDELVQTLGKATAELNLKTKPPAIILVAGLQGSGKTTTTAKLANFLKTKDQKKVLLVSTDIYRPAAIKQLEVLAEQINVEFFPSNNQQDPIAIANNAIEYAKKQMFDVLIIDTAGRLHVDAKMMQEIKTLNQVANPIETLFVVDSMTGQDAANTAKVFHDALPLTGVILTKTDGDARGGAALSIWHITGKPIKFIGTGEKIDNFEIFHPERIASRILGMGDIVSLVEEVEEKIDKAKAEKFAKKIGAGKKFDFEDFLKQLKQMQNLGGVSGLLGKLPGTGNLPTNIKEKINDKSFIQMRAIIQSMTVKERKFPALIQGSRKRRIAQGSGTQPQDVNKLLRHFEKMQKNMKLFTKKGMLQKAMQQMQGGNLQDLKSRLPF